MDFDQKYDQRATTDLVLSKAALHNIELAFDAGKVVSCIKLGGGFSNSNFRVEFESGFVCVARLSSDVSRLTMEADLLSLLGKAHPDLPVPEVLNFSTAPLFEDIACLLLSFLPGESIATIEDALPKSSCQDICAQLGKHAAAIHAIKFDKNGLLGPGPSISQPFPSYLDGTVSYLEYCLSTEILIKRAGTRRIQSLKSLMQRSELHLPPETEQLCHGDFNQKNILVNQDENGRWIVSAILDWEFALSGSGIMDIGNLLRFEGESPCIDSNHFVEAYQNAGGKLNENWRSQAMFADLLAQCSFLLNQEQRPKTFATALAVIDRYISTI